MLRRNFLGLAAVAAASLAAFTSIAQIDRDTVYFKKSSGEIYRYSMNDICFYPVKEIPKTFTWIATWKSKSKASAQAYLHEKVDARVFFKDPVKYNHIHSAAYYVECFSVGREFQFHAPKA